MKREKQRRLHWVRLYGQYGDVGLFVGVVVLQDYHN
jgi:hypothetical protein